MGRTKIELNLSPAEMQEFFLRLSQCKGGATGPAVKALAEEFGVVVSHDAANNFRTGPLKNYLERLEKNGQRARELVELAKANVPTSKANEVKLGMAISDRLDQQEFDLSADELEQMSRINARLRSSEDRSIELESRLQLTEQNRAIAEERAKKLERDREAWEKKQREIAEQVDRAKNATGKKAAEVRAAAVDEIDRIMGIKPAA